jgi:hypothetical protein
MSCGSLRACEADLPRVREQYPRAQISCDLYPARFLGRVYINEKLIKEEKEVEEKRKEAEERRKREEKEAQAWTLIAHNIQTDQHYTKSNQSKSECEQSVRNYFKLPWKARCQRQQD